MNPELLKKFRSVKLLVLVIDGVLTDGKLYYSAEGESLKVFHVLDGAGIKLLQKNNIPVAVISARNSKAAETRLTELGVEYLYQGQSDKMPAFIELCEKLGLNPKEVAYMGDDLADLPIMKQVGLRITVPNAVAIIKQEADYQTTRSGGLGAVREVCDLILHGN